MVVMENTSLADIQKIREFATENTDIGASDLAMILDIYAQNHKEITDSDDMNVENILGDIFVENLTDTSKPRAVSKEKLQALCAPFIDALTIALLHVQDKLSVPASYKERAHILFPGIKDTAETTEEKVETIQYRKKFSIGKQGVANKKLVSMVEDILHHNLDYNIDENHITIMLKNESELPVMNRILVENGLYPAKEEPSID